MTLKRALLTFKKPFYLNPYGKSIEQNHLFFKDILAIFPKTSKHIPWLNKSIKSKMKERKCLYDTAKKTKSLEAWESYRKLRSKIIKEIEI